MASAQKRQLDFHSGSEVIDEINRLRSFGYVRTKSWNLTQIGEHLTATMAGEMNGLGFRLPWLLRATGGRIFTHWILRTRKMPSVPTLPSLKPRSLADVEDDAIIEKCIETVAGCEAFTGSLDDYPFVDNLSHEHWRQLMWIHAAHHLGFLVPKSND